MKNLIQKLNHYWFMPMPAERLAILRIASGLFTLWYFITRYSSMVDIFRSDASNFEPVGLAAWLSVPLQPSVFMAIVWLSLALGVAFTLGWKYRYTALPFALLSLFVFSYRYSWSMIYHDNIALVLHTLVIALSPAADVYSLDARKRTLPEASWQYGWAVRLLCAATALTYFVSGVAKLAGELSWSWIDGSALRSQVAVDALRKEVFGGETSSLFYWVYAHHEFFLLMGVFTMIVELGAPLAIWNRKSRMVWAVLTWGMHIGIYFLMGITFRYQMMGLIFLPFFEVEKLVPWIKSRWVRWRAKLVKTGQTQPAVVLFDGVCNFCNHTVRFIAARDQEGRVNFASQQSEVGQALLAQYGVTTNLSTIVVIDQGRVFQRSSAVLHIARRMDGAWPLVYGLMMIPKVFRDPVYDWVARNRYRWFGKSEEFCALPAPTLRGRVLG